MELTQPTSGVGTPLLTAEEAEFLDRNGYVVLENILSDDELNAVRNRTDEILSFEGLSAGDVGQTSFQMQLRNGSGPTQKLMLLLYSMLFFVVRRFANLMFRLLPETKKAYADETQIASPPQAGPFRIKQELRQMIAAQAQQESAGIVRICDLVNKGPAFDILYTHPKVLAGVRHIIGDDVKLSSLNYRAPKQSHGLQNLHVDWEWAVRENEYYACNALWLLDDMTPGNGGTRVVPGSHTWEHMPNGKAGDLKDEHPEQIVVEAQAGSVLLVNSHTWHGGTTNKSSNRRRIIQSYFVHRAQTPQLLQRNFLRPETQKRLSPQVLELLDIL